MTVPRAARRRTRILVIVAVSIGVVCSLIALNVKAMRASSMSMAPTITAGERFFVNEASYWFGDPKRGDVILFSDPGGWLPEDGGHLVKRVVGVAGDTITCCDSDGRLSINGEPLDESDYVMPGADCATPLSVQAEEPCGAGALEIGPIPDGYLLVLGDNRGNSADSTVHVCPPKAADCPTTRGLVPVDRVVGKVLGAD